MDTSWQPISSLIAEDQRQKTFSVLQTFSKAVTDCLQDEMMLLNEDIQRNTIVSSLRKMISEEVIEFSEDAVERDCDGENALIEIQHNYLNREYDKPTLAKSMVRKTDGCDDACSDFLTRKNNRIYQDIPNLITFKSKKRKNNSNSEEIQRENRQLRIESHVEPPAKIKNYLKFPVWKRRQKRRAF
mmetsp:Transcript_26940/g.63271  ORF Transcript_26940/g.63271 Transcript_26940/m.63271 type:complete len:186 (-) Transcript_26940:224-781(-)